MHHREAPRPGSRTNPRKPGDTGRRGKDAAQERDSPARARRSRRATRPPAARPTLPVGAKEFSKTALREVEVLLNSAGRSGDPAMAAALEGLPTSVGVFIKVFDGVEVGFAVAAIQVARDAGFEQVTYVPSS